jgi:hydrogenase expression/formation protein HypD
MEAVFQVVDQPWRGLGVLAGGGLALRGEYRRLDARERFGVDRAFSVGGAGCCDGAGRRSGAGGESEAGGSGDSVCIAGAILRGQAAPPDCPAFGGACTPQHPLGAPMVSSEGACAAYHRYRPVPAPAA